MKMFSGQVYHIRNEQEIRNKRRLSEAMRALNFRALSSILKDYSDTPSENLGTAIQALSSLGFKFRDLTRETDPELRGVSIVQDKRDNIKPVAFVSSTRRYKDGELVVEVYRFDCDARVDTFEMHHISGWN